MCQPVSCFVSVYSLFSPTLVTVARQLGANSKWTGEKRGDQGDQENVTNMSITELMARLRGWRIENRALTLTDLTMPFVVAGWLYECGGN